MVLLLVCLTLGVQGQQFSIEDSTDYAALKARFDQWFNSPKEGAFDSAVYYSLRMREFASSKGNWEKYMDASSWYMYTHYVNGKHNKAVEIARTAIDTGLVYLGEKNLPVRVMYTHLAGLLGNEGKHDEALLWNKRAAEGLTVRANMPISRKKEVIDLWIKLGVAYLNQRDYEQAILAIEQAINQIGETATQNLESYGELLYNAEYRLGVTYARKGDIEKARPLLLKALDFAKEFFKNHNSWQIASCYQELGWLAIEAKNYILAKDYALKAMEAQKRCMAQSGRNFYPDNDMMLLGEALDGMGQTNEAIIWHKKAVATCKQSFGNEFDRNIIIGDAILKLADAYASKASWDSALIYYQEAKVHYSGHFSSLNIETLPTVDDYIPSRLSLFILRNKARAWQGRYQQTNNPEDLTHAFQTYLFLLEVLNASRTQYKGDNAQLFASSEAKSVYEAAIGTAISLATVKGDHAYIEEAFLLAEESKAYLLYLRQNNAKAQINLGLPEEVLTMELELKKQVASIRSRLISEQQKNENANTDSVDALQARLFEVNQRYIQKVDELEKSYPAYFKLKYNTDEISFEKICQ